MIPRFKSFILFILPLFYIFYVLYMRLIYERGIRILFVKISYLSIAITSLIILSYSHTIYVLLKKEKIIPSRTPTNKIIIWIKLRLYDISENIGNIWYNFYSEFIRRSLRMNLWIAKLVQFICLKLSKKFFITLLLVFEVLPRTIVVTTFIIDVFIFQQFYYFYKTLILILLPITFSTLEQIIYQFGMDNYAAMEKQIKKTTTVTVSSKINHYEFAEGYTPPDFIKDIEDFVYNHYLPVNNIPVLVAFMETLKEHYKYNWFKIIIATLYVIGWSTILIFGISV